MHGSEYHAIVPCVLLTAYKNCGSDIDLPQYLLEAWKRGRNISRGACRFLSVCGAAVGTGVYVSLLTETELPEQIHAGAYLENALDLVTEMCYTEENYLVNG